jgi:hypothetical protein
VQPSSDRDAWPAALEQAATWLTLWLEGTIADVEAPDEARDVIIRLESLARAFREEATTEDINVLADHIGRVIRGQA